MNQNIKRQSILYLRGKGWNVSTCGLSVGSEIFLGGTAGVSYSWIW